MIHTHTHTHSVVSYLTIKYLTIDTYSNVDESILKGILITFI